MSSQQASAVSPFRAGTRLMLLVLAVLVGLVAMHGLARGTAAPYTPPGAEHATAAAVPMGDAGDGEHAHQGQDGHAEHADAECAAGSVSTTPAFGPPTADALPAASIEGPGTARVCVDSTGGGRAPPSLSELQLLRI